MTVHVSGRRRVAGGLTALAAGAIALVGAFPSAAGAASAGGHSDLPFEHPCPGEGWYFHWGPTNQETVPGEHHQDDPAIDEPSSEEDFAVTISNVRVEGEKKTFDFETSVPVSVVFAMGYPNTDATGNIYEYEPAVTEGTAQVNDDTYIKHVVFCPAPEAPTTTTTAPTTTSTEAPTTTSTVPPSSETTVTTPPTSVEDTTPTTAPPTTAPPTTQPIGEELPRTGNNTMPLVAGAGALIALGAAAVAGRRYLQNRV